MKKLPIICFALSTLLSLSLSAQTIAEKKASFQKAENEMDLRTLDQLREVNSLLEEKRTALAQFYAQARLLYSAEAPLTSYEELLQSIEQLKAEIAEIQQMWRAETSSLMQTEEYALWHQPDTTLQQLVLDYGAPDYIYFISPEIGGIRMSFNSALPIPRESWGECLELILEQYGVGIRQLNPYLRELYILRTDPSGIKGIVDHPSQFSFYAPTQRICYILSPSSVDPRGDLLFLQKFSNPVTTKLEMIGGKIFISASVTTIQELLKLYDFANASGRKQEFQLVTLTKIQAKEMETILNSAFHDSRTFSGDGSTLRVILLGQFAQTLFISGSQEEVKKALALTKAVEAQVEDPREKTVFWYTTKHSDPEELASVLAKVYDLLVGTVKVSEGKKEEGSPSPEEHKDLLVVPTIQVRPKDSSKKTSHKTADGQNNFIVDSKTGAIIMVVEADALPKIQELLKKLDVPKKMVQIEVLLFEKKVSRSSSFGLNLLRLGQNASQKMGLEWVAGPLGAGILEFLVSRGKESPIPAYDLAYQFMLGQEDVQINASPSVTTLNQTPASIAIVEEVSIDSGADNKKSRIYTRAQYGITIQITPTINMEDKEESDAGFVTLETDITFDTPKKNQNDRPDVTRRHIKNHVRIADGQTVILGGLRRKNSQENKDSIPFLGEIPGIGKLFSHTDMRGDSTEMFVFITPKIIADPIQEAEKRRREELKRRPGDLPEFLYELRSAQEKEKKRLFAGSLSMLFGSEGSSFAQQSRRGEYDGR